MIGLIDPSISSKNLGDKIISNACRKHLNVMFPNEFFFDVSSHSFVNGYAFDQLKKCKDIFVLGSNLLGGSFKQWDIDQYEGNHFKVILFGCGWNCYEDDIEKHRIELNNILRKDVIHSVRDEYTRQQLARIGIHNVVITSCPVVWDCKNITNRFRKASNCVVTLTDYSKSEYDINIVHFAESNFNRVKYWPQGSGDIEYFLSLGISFNRILRPRISDLNDIVEESGAVYLGTRLHAGLFSMRKNDSLIISIDNRAKELLKYINVSFVDRDENLHSNISRFIEHDIASIVKFPSDNIKKWKDQFK